MDCGSRVYVNYGQASANDWTQWQYEYDPANVLVKQIITYDNGTVLTI